MDWLKYFYWDSWFPANASSSGAQIDDLYRLIYWLTAVAFLLVMVLLVGFLVAYRAKPGRKAVYHHGNSTLELVWTLIPAAIFIWLAFHSQTLWDNLRGKMPPGDVHIGVTGKQFNWFFHYPGQDGQLGQARPYAAEDGGMSAGYFMTSKEGPEKDNVQKEGVLVVPVNKTIRVSIAAHDVIHSFFLPNMRLKQDAVPGRTVEVWFKPIKTGEYEVVCAELCGMDHSHMKATLKVLSDEDYAKWLAENPKNFPPAGAKQP